MDSGQLCCLDLPVYLDFKTTFKLNYWCEHYGCLMVRISYNVDELIE